MAQAGNWPVSARSSAKAKQLENWCLSKDSRWCLKAKSLPMLLPFRYDSEVKRIGLVMDQRSSGYIPIVAKYRQELVSYARQIGPS